MRRCASLSERLRERIKREGPITFREWMDAALFDESEGYYSGLDRVRWGRAGDYRTSPERSPLFASTFARYFAKLYEELHAPSDWTILEAGAGSGHFARGVLRTLAGQYPQVFAATRYVIDERSASLGARLREFLGQFEDRVEFLPIDKIQTPIKAGIIFSNELLDAMPVHRVVMRQGKLFELCVGLNEDDEFIWIETEPTTPRLDAYFNDLDVCLNEGQIAEVNLAANDWVRRTGKKLSRGYMICVDYGAESNDLYDSSVRHNGTLRAIQRHRFAKNILANPGERDITTTVDWTSIKQAGEESGLETVVFERQDHFLLRVGLLDQLEVMTAASRSEADRVILRTSAREMILPGGMSERFQVLVQKAGE